MLTDFSWPATETKLNTHSCRKLMKYVNNYFKLKGFTILGVCRKIEQGKATLVLEVEKNVAYIPSSPPWLLNYFFFESCN